MLVLHSRWKYLKDLNADFVDPKRCIYFAALFIMAPAGQRRPSGSSGKNIQRRVLQLPGFESGPFLLAFNHPVSFSPAIPVSLVSDKAGITQNYITKNVHISLVISIEIPAGLAKHRSMFHRECILMTFWVLSLLFFESLPNCARTT